MSLTPRWILLVVIYCLSACSHVTPSSQQAAVASAHPLATEAGLAVLAQGGNAFDAAIAVSAALAVVEPAGSGLGGGGFWLLHRAVDNKTVMIDGREVAPALAHKDMYLDEQGQAVPSRSLDGPLSAAIPGMPAALDYLSQHYGQLPLQHALAPAIRYAQQGFPISTYYQQLAQFRLSTLQSSPDAAAIFLQNNQVPELGYLLKQPDLAKTLTLLAEQGKAGFYQGEIADELIASVQAAGGIWQAEDLANYRVVERDPIVSSYQNYAIYSAAPPSSGGIVLASIINQLSALPFDHASEQQRRHFIIEAMRRAYYDRSQWMGDPDFVSIPPYLTSPKYGEQLAADINPTKASQSQNITTIAPKGEDTTHFSIIDQYGNRVAATLSINYPFGSGFVAGQTGVLLNDEMDDFSAQIGAANGYGLTGNEANAIAPFKRPLSSMSPTFIENEQEVMVIGTPGGSRIITMVLLGILDFVEGKSAEEIVSAPRFHHQYLPDVVQLESQGFDQQWQQELLDYGHELKMLNRQYGNMQVIIQQKHNAQLDFASDPRGEGEARSIRLD